MYPAWVEKVVKSAKCRKCGRVLGCEHIVGLSALLVKSRGFQRDGPVCSVALMCPSCEAYMQRMGATDRQGMQQAVEALYLRRRMPSPFDENAAPETPKPWSSTARVTPSNTNCPLTEIAERDVQRFLRMLNRTSFKRSSLSWQKLLRRFGCDL